MITVALHESLELCDADLRSVVGDVAQTQGEPISIRGFTSAIGLADMLMRDGICSVDLVIFPQEMTDTSGLGAFAETKDAYPLVRGIMFAESAEIAANAAAVGVDVLLLKPVAADNFKEHLQRQFKAISALHEESFVMETRDKSRRVRLSQIVYCTTSGHDQEVHLTDGTVLLGRYSSQALFDLMGQPLSFFKAGRSYILNLREVTEANTGNGIAIMTDGTNIVIPSRIRKNFEGSLLFGE